MFRRILIANRGEIACRVIRTARRLGVETVAVYSDIDANAMHVQEADKAVCIGTAEAASSYLDSDAVLNAALQTGAEAIHPGYGFLSENSAFAKACVDKGVVFIGPPASAMDAMASKSAAKKLMQESAVPVLPGYHGDDQDLSVLQQHAEKTGYPLMLKASSGGGGKGMRIVKTANEFDSMLKAVKRESLASFGDDHVLMERYLENPRHIEIQIFSDTHDNHVHLFERDCSVQRRHQKVLEESPAPGISDEQRQLMGQAAINAARAIGYVGAGTVEFIASQDGEFFFMEMNTRLQVEHPVTELVTSTVLVEWQLRVAAGEQLPKQQNELGSHGHAIEARLYAEDPANGFLPASGKLDYIGFPQADSTSSKTIRIDTGVRTGDTVSVFYDPMIAKVIAWGKNRESAIQSLDQALANTHIIGPVTNLQYLRYLLNQPAFAAGGVSTGFIESLEQQERGSGTDSAKENKSEATLWNSTDILLAFALIERAAGLADRRAAQTTSNYYSGDYRSDYRSDYNWRLNSVPAGNQLWQCEDQLVRAGIEHQSTQQKDAAPTQSSHYSINLQPIVARSGDGKNKQSSTDDSDRHISVKLIDRKVGQKSGSRDAELTHLTLEINGYQLEARLCRQADTTIIYPQPGINGHLQPASPVVKRIDTANLTGNQSADSGSLVSPMPGKVIAVHVKAGESVSKGQPLLAVEAMKMEHVIEAPEDGQIDEVCFNEGDSVADKATLVKMSPVD